LRPTKIAGLVLGFLALFFIGFLIVGTLLPSAWEAERSVRIAASAERIFPYVSEPARWPEWTETPESGIERFGPETGPGAGYRWDDPTYGQGEFVVESADAPREVRYAVEVDDGAILIRGRIELATNDGATSVSWREEGDFGWNPLLGYLVSRMNELQGAQMEASLANLKGLAEGSGATTARD
jgi:uncharacterized protein YndB with AHSA1/START domain